MPKVSIAIFGATGAIGESLLKALICPHMEASINFPILAVSRKELPSTDKIKHIVSDFSNVDDLITQLEGINVLIELLSPCSVLFAATEKTALKIKPDLFIASKFGIDLEQVQPYAPGFLSHMSQHSSRLRSFGIKTVTFANGHLAIPGSYVYEHALGLGIDCKTPTYFTRGDINQKLAITKLEDLANTISIVATFSEFGGGYSKLPNTLRIFSEVITVKDVIDRYEKNHNVKLTESGSQTKEEALKEFQDIWSKGFKHDDFPYYAHVIVSQGLDKGTLYSEDHRELVNPGEAFWKWKKF